jgi:hypothetical protein
MILRIVAALFIAVVTMPGRLQAQNASEVSAAEPQYIDIFYAVDAHGRLIDLEHQTVTYHNKVVPLPGYASVKVVSKFKPNVASVRVPSTAQFIVRGHDHIDPASLYELRPLEASKDHREFVTTQGHGSVFTGAKMTNLDQQALAVRFEQYGSSSYRIIPEQPLPPGEYALAVRGRFSELYCFGVDQ